MEQSLGVLVAISKVLLVVESGAEKSKLSVVKEFVVCEIIDFWDKDIPVIELISGWKHHVIAHL